MVVNSNDNAGTGLVRPDRTTCSKPSTSDLDEGRFAIGADEGIERRGGHGDGFCPNAAPPVPRSSRSPDEAIPIGSKRWGCVN